MENQSAISILDYKHHRININGLENILNAQAQKRVPHKSSFLESATNLYRAILPVIDLRKRLNPSSGSDSSENQVVIDSMKGAEVSMVVDGVFKVLTIHDSDTDPAPHMMITIDSDFISGIVRLERQIIIRLDLGTLAPPDRKD
jgi:purine-binding chemotaxis protein CheW